MHLIFIDRDQTAGAKHGLRRNTAPEIANWLASRIETTNDFRFDSFFHRLLNIRKDRASFAFDFTARTGVCPVQPARKSSSRSSTGVDDPHKTDHEESLQ
jgi:hypothetical protein